MKLKTHTHTPYKDPIQPIKLDYKYLLIQCHKWVEVYSYTNSICNFSYLKNGKKCIPQFSTQSKEFLIFCWPFSRLGASCTYLDSFAVFFLLFWIHSFTISKKKIMIEGKYHLWTEICHPWSIVISVLFQVLSFSKKQN